MNDVIRWLDPTVRYREDDSPRDNINQIDVKVASMVRVIGACRRNDHEIRVEVLVEDTTIS